MISLGKALGYIQTLGKPSAGEQITLLNIINLLDQDTDRKVQGSAKEFAKLIGNSPRAFQRQVADLKIKGIIKVDNDTMKHQLMTANKYSLPGWHNYVTKETA